MIKRWHGNWNSPCMCQGVSDTSIDNIQNQQNRAVPALFPQNGENEMGKDRVAAGNEERARAQPDTSERDRGNHAGPEREKSTKFISGHPRAEPRPGTNSIASVALFRGRAHGTLAGVARRGGWSGWMVGSLAGDRAILPPRLFSLTLLRPSRPGVSHCGWPEVTGSPELGIFMRAHPPTGALPVIRKLRIYYRSPLPPPSGSSALSAHHSRSPPDLLPLLRYCPPSSRRGSGPRVISAFMGRDRHGSSGNVPDDGEKKLRQGWVVVGFSERGWTKLIIRALWLLRNPYHSLSTIVEISHDDGRWKIEIKNINSNLFQIIRENLQLPDYRYNYNLRDSQKQVINFLNKFALTHFRFSIPKIARFLIVGKNLPLIKCFNKLIYR